MKRVLLPALGLAGLLTTAALAQMASPPPAMPKAGSELTIKLGAQNNSGETGTAKLSQTSDGLVVTLTITPAPSVAQPAHIHKGTCAKLDPAPAYPLKSVTGGTSTTTLTNVSLSDLMKGQFAINVHKSASDLGTYVACGDIKAASSSGM